MLRGSLGVIRAFSTLFWGVWLIFIANGLLLSSTAIILKNEAQFATGAITACFFIGAIFNPQTLCQNRFCAQLRHHQRRFCLGCFAAHRHQKFNRVGRRARCHRFLLLLHCFNCGIVVERPRGQSNSLARFVLLFRGVLRGANRRRLDYGLGFAT